TSLTIGRKPNVHSSLISAANDVPDACTRQSRPAMQAATFGIPAETNLAITLIQCAVDLAVEADDAPRPGIGDEPHVAALPRLETGRGAGRDVEAAAARLVAVELQGRIGLEEMVMRADLDRPVAGIRDGERDGRAAGVQLDIAIGGKQLPGDHPRPPESPSPCPSPRKRG